MITSRDELRFWLKEDAKRNTVDCSFLKYLFFLFCGLENAVAYRYLWNLRHAEYHCNKNGLLHKLGHGFYRIRISQLGLKYHIQIPINVAGYGLRIIHLSGGGIILNAKSIGNYCGFNSGVIIGNKDSEDNKPTIGNHVAFAPGSSAFGKITIGDKSL